MPVTGTNGGVRRLRLRRARRDRRRLLRFAAPAVPSALGGALFAYLFDPRNGRRRRHTARDRVLSRARRTERRAFLGARRAQWRAVGAARRAVSARRPKEQPDDVTLAHKVESELFRDPQVPKGRLNVNAEDGVVFLRGVVEDESTIRSLEDAARRIAGVRGVENLLHLPGTPPPPSRPRTVRERDAPFRLRVPAGRPPRSSGGRTR
jgi:hypothetical protein